MDGAKIVAFSGYSSASAYTCKSNQLSKEELEHIDSRSISLTFDLCTPLSLSLTWFPDSDSSLLHLSLVIIAHSSDLDVYLWGHLDNWLPYCTFFCLQPSPSFSFSLRQSQYLFLTEAIISHQRACLSILNLGSHLTKTTHHSSRFRLWYLASISLSQEIRLRNIVDL